MSVEELLNRCKKIGMKIVAITDHDTVRGVMNVKERVQDGMKIISGMELSSYSDTESYIHLACYFPKTANLPQILEEMDSHVREVRVQRCKTILGKLEQDGYHIPYSDIEAKTKDCYPSLPIIAQCLLVSSCMFRWLTCRSIIISTRFQKRTSVSSVQTANSTLL